MSRKFYGGEKKAQFTFHRDPLFSFQLASYGFPLRIRQSTHDQEEDSHPCDVLLQQHQQDLHIEWNQTPVDLCNKANKKKKNLRLGTKNTVTKEDVPLWQEAFWTKAGITVSCNRSHHDKHEKSKHLPANLANFSIKMTSSRLDTSSNWIQTQLPSNLHYHLEHLPKNSNYFIGLFNSLDSLLNLNNFNKHTSSVMGHGTYHYDILSLKWLEEYEALGVLY